MISFIVFTCNKQKEVFTGAFQKSFSDKMCNIHRKAHVLEFLFNEVVGLKVCKLVKN